MARMARAALLPLLLVSAALSLSLTSAQDADWNAIARGLDPSGTVLGSWTTGAPPCNGLESSFMGVTCNTLSDVVSISLPARSLNGSVPQELGNLRTLTSLNLNNNGLSGNVPQSIGDLAQMHTLVICCNALSGDLPPMPQLGQLTVLDFSHNQFAGNIPDTLSSLTAIRALELNDNKLSGTIPPSLGNLKLLTSLNLNNNPDLEGPVPAPVAYLIRPGSDFNFSNNPNMCGPRFFGLTPCPTAGAPQRAPVPKDPAAAPVPAPSLAPAPAVGVYAGNSAQASSSDSQGIVGPLTLPMLIGIGAGVLAIALCAILLLFFCCFHRKRSSRKALSAASLKDSIASEEQLGAAAAAAAAGGRPSAPGTPGSTKYTAPAGAVAVPIGPGPLAPDADLAPPRSPVAPAATPAVAVAGVGVAAAAAGAAALATSRSSRSKPTVAPQETVLDVKESDPQGPPPARTTSTLAANLEAGAPAPKGSAAAVAAGAGAAAAAGAAARAAAMSVRSRRGSSEKLSSMQHTAAEAQAVKATPAAPSTEAGPGAAEAAAADAAKPKPAATWMSAFGWGAQKEAKSTPAPGAPVAPASAPVAAQAPASTPGGAPAATPPGPEPSAGPNVAAAAAVGAAAAAGAGFTAAAVSARGRKAEEEQKAAVEVGSTREGQKAAADNGYTAYVAPTATAPAEEVPHGAVPLPVLRSLSAAYLREDDPRATAGAGQDPSELSNEGMVAAAAAAAALAGGATAAAAAGGAVASGRTGPRIPELQEDSDVEERGRVGAAGSRERVTPPMPLPPPGAAREEAEEREGEAEETDDDDDDEDEVGTGPRWYSVSELAQGTVGFSDARVLGAGRYGTVYKATLADGTNVAVKRLGSGTHLDQSMREFRFEVDTMVGLSRHANLVALLGGSASEGSSERMLVYEYLPNGNLDALLHPSSSAYPGSARASALPNGGMLSWPMRMHIALGCARGLSHLHEGADMKVVHRDVKASNVLLDNNWEAKLGDYALAKILGRDELQAKTRVMGTFGYVAPDYLNSGILTERSDVYSFGVLLLEIITGRRPVENGAPPDEVDTVVWVKRMAEEGSLDLVVDPRLLPAGGVATDDAEYVLGLALRCVETNALKRPKMSQVVKMLESEDVIVNGEQEQPMTPTPVWAGGGYAQSYAGGMVSPRALTPDSPRATADMYYSPASTMASGRTSPRYTSPYGGPTSPRTAGLGYTSSGASGGGRPLGRPTSAGGGVRTPTYGAGPGGYTSRYAGGAAGSMMVSSPTAGGSLTPLGSRRSTSPRHPTSDVGSLIASAAYKATSPRAGTGPSGVYYTDSPTSIQPMRPTSSGRGGYAAGNRSPSHDRSAGNLIAGHAMNVVPNPRRNSHPGHQEYR